MAEGSKSGKTSIMLSACNFHTGGCLKFAMVQDSAALAAPDKQRQEKKTILTSYC